MKPTLLIEEGRTQLVITPETETEQSLVKAIQAGGTFKPYFGTFYDCKGGWTRQKSQYRGQFNEVKQADSLILVCDGDEQKTLREVG